VVTTEAPITRTELREEMASLKADVQGGMASLKTDIRGEMASLKVDIRQELALLRDEFRQHYATKADLKELELRLMVRLGGLMITGFALVIGVMRLWP
jgi:hypothetical protein